MSHVAMREMVHAEAAEPENHSAKTRQRQTAPFSLRLVRALCAKNER